MKQRFSSLDVKVIAHELNQQLVSLRIANIYDLSSRIFLFKCAKPGSKAQLLVDSGFRCHLTSFTRTAASAPSAFVSRLRKYIKSRRITGVKQIGTDRVIEITFSDGTFRLYLEFFAAGNIVLTDADLNVIALLRQVSEGDEDVDIKLGGKYILDAKQNYHGLSTVNQDTIKDAIEKQIARVKTAQEIGGKKAKRNKGGDDIRKAMSAAFPEYPPHFMDHVFALSDFDVNTKLEDIVNNEALLSNVGSAMKIADDAFKALDSSEIAKGYIIAKVQQPKSVEGEEQQEERIMYDDFHPFEPAQFKDKPDARIIQNEGFNKTVDEFYSSLESQKLESRLTEREQAAKKKLDTAKKEHEKRLAGLQQVQELHIRKAQAIEANTHRVEEATQAVNGLVGQGMDWVDIGKLIEREQKRENAVAQMIKLPLKLHENTVTLLLDEPGVDEDSDEEITSDYEDDSDIESKTSSLKKSAADTRLTIDIDLALTPWANATQYYNQKKDAAQKEVKTVAASEMALKSMQKKTEADLKKTLKGEKDVLRVARKPFWFEKFLYFLSSDGYLVLGGKDAQQNELLYRRYLKTGDIYVHADLQGASSVIVKNNPQTPDAPIPPSTLSQAGALSVCSSSAWDSKAVMAAWWVKSDQVSKTAPTGEYLKTGGFIINGQKNFLPPSQLILGFGVYWLISEESKANHGRHRLDRTESMVDGEAEALAREAQGLNLDEDDQDTAAGDAVPDVEDAGQAAKEEVEEDENADDGSGEDSDNDSDNEVENRNEQRSNPLQMQRQKGNASMTVTEDEAEDNITADETDKDEAATSNAQNDPLATNTAGEDSASDSSVSDEDEATTKTANPGTSTPHSTNSNAPTSTKKPKRGANTKAARRRLAKYAEQDESDRTLAMDLLGSTKAQARKQAEAESKAAREAKAQADRERRKAQHDKAAAAEAARQQKLAKRKADAEAGDTAAAEALEEDEELSAEQAEQERREHMNISALVPAPAVGDELLAAIPVAAPFAALSKCKYKVKLQPGSVKKGKALREILGVWTGLDKRGAKVVDEAMKDKDKVWPREVELIRGWRVEEIVGVLPAKGVRVVQSGGTVSVGGAHGGQGGGRVRGGRGKGKKR